MAKESPEAALQRWRKLELLQETYPAFVPFLQDCMEELGFSTTEIQEDIATFLEFGPQYLMVMAQRGEAKTTITACFAVWCLIHNPAERILVFSAGETQASEVSTLIIRLIMSMPELECMRPDPQNGDRTSVEHFDVHYTLKGIDKSPSVACVGVTGNLQGKRAGILIADDVESMKNSRTAPMRELLLNITKDFTSICDTGRIIYLGTPQSNDSVYNSLPARGFTVRIWPGRYPTPDQLEHYGEHLAPIVARRLKADPSLGTGGGALGDQGQSVDPQRYSELQLQQKELDQGPAMFQLQFMLNTALMDKGRHPLRPQDLVLLHGVGHERPLAVLRSLTGAVRDFSIGDFNYKVSLAHKVSEETGKVAGPIMYIDPAGGGANADETAYAVTAFLNGTVHLLSWGGVPGGYRPETMESLAAVAKRHRVTLVIIEKNFGYGAFREVFTPVLSRVWGSAGIQDDMVHGQKELRIIGTLEPVMARGALVIAEEALQEDIKTLPGGNKLYSGVFQLAKITRARDALVHDDRVDALEGAVRHWQAQIAQDQEKRVAAIREQERLKWFKDPLGHQRTTRLPTKQGARSTYLRK